MINLFHGTNVSFDTIELSRCRPYKDFGKGFYLTDIRSQAEEMAIRRTNISRGGEPVVLKFCFNDELLSNGDLNILQFDSPSEEWAKFILKNRMDIFVCFKYEILRRVKK